MAEGKSCDNESQLRREHNIFATEVVNFLMINSKLEPYRISNYRYFTREIGDAILTISNIYRRDFRTLCQHLSVSLINIERFKEYCELIPVSKTETYFYNYLKSIALIHEMAMFCYVNNYSKKDDYKHFEVACISIQKYPDLDFFEHVGGWRGLKSAAAFIASSGRPLELILLPQYVKDAKSNTFEDVVGKLHKEYLYSGNIEMLDSPEMTCLEQLKLFKVNVVNNRKILCNTESEENTKLEKSIIVGHFECCFSKTVQRKEKRNSKDLDNSSTNGSIGSQEDLSDSEGSQDDDVRESGKIVDCTVQKLSMHVFNALFKLENEENEIIAKYNQERRDAKTRDEKKNILLEDKPMLSPEMKDDSTENDHHTKKSSDYVAPGFSGLSTESCAEENKIENEVDYPSAPEQSDRPPEFIHSTIVEVRTSEIEQPSESVSDLAKNNEPETKCSITTEESSVKWNFIVPQLYLKSVETSKECEYFYSVRAFPVFRRELLNQRLKTILDTNIAKGNYKMLASGDVFVCPPDSSKKAETLLIIADSSPNYEISDDILGLLCLLKKNDIDHEEKCYQLRPRDSCKSTVTETNQSSSSGSTTKANTKLKSQIETEKDDQVFYAEYLIQLYKRYLPEVLVKRLPLLFCKAKVLETCSNLNADSKENTLFIISARMLAKRKVSLQERDESIEDMRGLLLSGWIFQKKNLPLPEKRKLDSCILDGIYHPIDLKGSTYMVGSKFNDRSTFLESEIWLLFFPYDSMCSDAEDNFEILNLYALYKEAILSWCDCSEFFRNYLCRLEDDIGR